MKALLLALLLPACTYSTAELGIDPAGQARSWTCGWEHGDVTPLEPLAPGQCWRVTAPAGGAITRAGVDPCDVDAAPGALTLPAGDVVTWNRVDWERERVIAHVEIVACP